jgi:putative membrane protein
MLSFTDADRQRITEAVTQAERRTTGEIIPMIVPSSARYREAGYRTGLIVGWLVLAALLTLEPGWFAWGWHAGNAGWLLLAVLMAYAAGEWLGTRPTVIRLVTSRERMAYKVRLRAQQAFYEHGLQHTKGRTGILIFISLLEHRVQVLADKGINDCVPAGTWDSVVAGVVDGIKSGRPTDALCAAIQRCGELLAEKCPAPFAENPNELPDRLIQEP